jgi:hypothetical protein
MLIHALWRPTNKALIKLNELASSRLNGCVTKPHSPSDNTITSTLTTASLPQN